MDGLTGVHMPQRHPAEGFRLVTRASLFTRIFQERIVFMRTPKNETEKRQYPRIQKLYLVSYVNEIDGRQISPVSMGRTLNISQNGVGVEVYQHIEKNSIMQMEIAIENADFSVRGRVVRVHEVDEKVFVLGIQFDGIHPELTGRDSPHRAVQ